MFFPLYILVTLRPGPGEVLVGATGRSASNLFK